MKLVIKTLMYGVTAFCASYIIAGVLSLTAILMVHDRYTQVERMHQ